MTIKSIPPAFPTKFQAYNARLQMVRLQAHIDSLMLLLICDWGGGVNHVSRCQLAKLQGCK